MVMKVIILGPAFPLRGGIADFNEALCKAFEEKRIKCQIVSFSLQYPSILFPGKSQYVPSNTVKPAIDIVSKLSSINPFSWIKTANYIKKQNPDLVISSYWLPFTGFSLASVLRMLRGKTKLISLAHNIIPHQRLPFDSCINSFYIKQNDGFVLLSEAVSKDLDKYLPSAKRVVVPHPVYDIFGKGVSRKEALEVLNLDAKFDYILFFGLIKPYKGLKYLLQAMNLLKDKLPNLRLIVAGEFYEDEKPYKDFIVENGLEEKIFLYPRFIPNEEVKYFFSAADIVVQPYLSATQSGITQVAYNFNKPMIVTDVGGLREIVLDGKTGYVVPKEDANAIANAIKRFYKEKDEIDFESNVEKIKKKFSWDSFVDKVLMFYNELR